MGRDVFYITTPIYYPNDVPHIGHAYNAVATDFIARYHRLRGEEVFHLTGTDEHGLKLQRAAEAAGMAPQEWVDAMEPRWREVWARLDIAYDDYIRTTEPRHRQAVEKLLLAVHDNGRDDIYLGSYEGLYCVSCELYYTEGDLVDGNCPIHGRPVERMSEEKRFRRYWPALHLIGKDILRQHAIYWPAMLLAAGIAPPRQVWAHGFLLVGGQKMSKTNATGVHPFELIDHFGVDAYRYYFMREIQFGQDGGFSWESMVDRYNADLANGLGNLASRVLAMIDSYFDGLVPDPAD